jgi:hypothetical protein
MVWAGEDLMDDNATHWKLARFARYLGRVSTATRLVGIVTVIAGVLLMLVGLVQLSSGHRNDDGLALMALGITVSGIGVLVWSTGVFHGAMAHALTVFGWVDGKLWEMMQVLRQQAGAPAPTPVNAAAPATLQSAEPKQQVEGAGDAGGPASTEPVQAGPAEPRAGATEPTPATTSMEQPAGDTAAPPKTMRCRHCGGEIPTHVLRCRHCLERV